METRKTKVEKYADVIKHHRTFLFDCEEARRRFLLTVKYNNAGKLLSWNAKTLREEVEWIMGRYPNTPDSLEKSIESYLKDGKMSFPTSVTAPLINFEKYEPGGRSKLSIQIFKYTTKKEYLETWKEVEKYQKWMHEFNPTALSKADLVMLALYKKGKTSEEIAEHLSINSLEIYGEDKEGNTPEAPNIRTRLKTLRRHLGVSKNK